MSTSQITPLPERTVTGCLSGLDPASPTDVGDVLLRLLRLAQTCGATDVHFRPAPEGLHVTWRCDGVVQPLLTLPREVATNYVSRLKVMADLLTYRSEIPQEGRLRADFVQDDVEMRVSTFPTIHGERAAVRLFAGASRYRHIDELGLSDSDRETLRNMLWETGGLLLITGPAGSGKTTTAYACTRYLLKEFGHERIIVTLEDPVETVVDGVVQCELRPAAGFDYPTGLKSLLRQDPDVILVGEIRDHTAAVAAMQACLTGHLVISTFHAGSAAEAVGRLANMGIEPYVLQSGLLGVLCQRLLRRLCNVCSVPAEHSAASETLGLNVQKHRTAVGCEVCRHTGYAGRILITELLDTAAENFDRSALTRRDVRTIEAAAVAAGMQTCLQRAAAAVESGLTTVVEVRRVMGFR